VVWTVIAAVLVTLQHVASKVLRSEGYAFTTRRGARYFIDGWSQFDGPEYIAIAQTGYWYVPGVESPVVWFPAYPIALRALNQFVGDPILAGMIVASIAGLTAVGLFWRWLDRQGIEGSARVVAFLALITYPYAWYLYGVVHSDALFLASTIGAFLLVENRRLMLAGLAGAVATAARPTGIAVIPALVVLSLERGGVLTVPAAVTGGHVRRWIQRFQIPTARNGSAFRPALLLPLLSVLGIGAYMTYLGLRFGDPLAFKTNQTTYHPSPWPILKRPFLVRVRDFGLHPTYTLTVAAQAIVTAVVAISTPFVGRRFGWGYAVFVGTLVAIPTVSTADFMGTGRYMIAAFPVAALLGERLALQRYRWHWLAISGLVMAGLSMGFARGWYLS
jgi:hypothetical protein